MKKPLEPEVAMRRRSLVAMAWAALAIIGGVSAVSAVMNAPAKDGIPAPLRSVLEANGRLASSLASNSNSAEKYDRKFAEKPRYNGGIGMSAGFDPSTWKLHFVGGKGDNLTIEDIKKLPSTEIVTRFKCVEGWSQIVQAKGVKFSDFLKVYGPDLGGEAPSEKTLSKLPLWVGLETPDKEYYVGVDMKSMLHPQTLLCYEMDGKPLPDEHGAPLRLVIPIKYGIKSLKRIGTLTLTNERPRDYWFERGYDYYAGH